MSIQKETETLAHSDSGLLWVESVCSDWPGPIAHEYQALRAMFPETRAAAMAGEYRVLEAFLQLRDVAELLLKLPTVVMLRDADRLNLSTEKIKGGMLGSPPSFGSWYGWGYTLAKMIQTAEDAWTRDVARVFRTDRGKMTGLAKLFDGHEGLIHWRNRELAHGALRKDLAGLGRELTEKAIAFNEQLATVADGCPWANVTLRIAGSPAALIGGDSIRHHHDQSAGDHVEKTADIVAMSALLTTTMPNMVKVMYELKKSNVRERVKVIVGGAPVTDEFAKRIGADGFAKDASQAANLAASLVGVG